MGARVQHSIWGWADRGLELAGLRFGLPARRLMNYATTLQVLGGQQPPELGLLGLCCISGQYLCPCAYVPRFPDFLLEK